MFSGLETIFNLMFWALIVSVPFAVWKLIEIAVWAFTHIHIG